MAGLSWKPKAGEWHRSSTAAHLLRVLPTVSHELDDETQCWRMCEDKAEICTISCKNYPTIKYIIVLKPAAIAGACKPIICMCLSCWLNYSNKMPEVFCPSQTVHPWFHLLYAFLWNKKKGNCQKFNLVNCQIQKNPKGEHNCQVLQVLIKCMLTEFHCSCRHLHCTCPVTKGMA